MMYKVVLFCSVFLLFSGLVGPAVPKLGTASHPKLYFNADELVALRTLEITPSQQAIWNKIKVWADDNINNFPPTEGSWDLVWASTSFLENVGLTYVLTNDSTYADAAKRWTLAVADLESWGNAPTTALVGTSVAFSYDVLYNYLTAAERSTIRSSIRTKMNYVYNYYDADISDSSLRAYPNVAIDFAGGLGLCGLAFEGESDVPEATSWISYAQKLVRFAISLGGSDGGWFEGPNYAADWAFAIEFLDALKRVKGVDLFDNEFLRQLPYYFIYATYDKKLLPLEDTIWNVSTISRTTFIYKLASEYNDGHAQWFANQATSALLSTEQDYSLMAAFVFNDPKVVSKPPSDLPLTRYFSSIGYVISRSGWGNRDMVFVFKSGTSVGHAHNSQNEFQIYDNGHVVTSGPGNVAMTALDDTWSHNSLLVEGLGQGQELGDYESLPIGTKGIVDSVDMTKSSYVYMKGDASKVYSGALNKWLRQIIYSRDLNYLVIDDDVAASEAKQFDFLLQAPKMDDEAGKLSVTGNEVTLTRNNEKLVVDVVEPHDFNSEIVRYNGPNGVASYIKVHPSQKSNSAQFLTVLFPIANNEQALSTLEINSGNLIGVKIINGDNIDLVLFSADGKPVDQFVELGGSYESTDGGNYQFSSTRVRVQFNTYLVMKLKASNPNITPSPGNVSTPTPNVKWFLPVLISSLLVILLILIIGYFWVRAKRSR